MQAEGLPGFSALWPSVQALAASAKDEAEEVALATCIAKLASLPTIPVAQVTESLLPLILSRLSAPAAYEVRLCSRVRLMYICWCPCQPQLAAAATSSSH